MAPITSEDLYEFRWVDHVRLSPSGERLAYHLGRADREARENRARIQTAVLAPELQAPVDLGAGNRDRHPEWSPDGSRIAFAAKQGPRDQIFVIDAGGGEARRLTSLPDGAAAPAWSRDGSRIAFLGTVLADPDGVVDDPRPPETEDQARRSPVARVWRRLDDRHDGRGYNDGRHPHLFVVNASGEGEPVQLTDGSWDVEGYDWAPDGRRWAVAGNAEPDADRTLLSHLYVAEAGAELRRVTSELNVSSPAWSPRGDLIAFLAPAQLDGGRHLRLWVVSPDGGEPRCLTSAMDQNVGGLVISDMRAGHGVGLVWNEAGDRVYFVAATPGASELYSVDLEGNVRREAPSPYRSIYDFDVRQGVIVFAAGDPWTPGDVFLLRDGQEMRLSEFNLWLREREVAIPEKHRFSTSDGLTIEGWLLKPPGFDPAVRHPLVLQIHGGPHAQYGWPFFHEFQVLAAMGFLVFYCNPRGSDGRSEDFKRGVVHDWGGKDFSDLMASLEQLIDRTSYIDEDRLGVAGGSYGGYMTNWVIGQTTRFKAAVAMRSICDLVADYPSSDIVPWSQVELGPEPWPDADELWKRSPIRYVKNVRTPLLLTHGEMDLRCPISQAEEMFGALRLLGQEVELVRFPGESHDLSRGGRPDRRVERLNRIAGWFGRHLQAD